MQTVRLIRGISHNGKDYVEYTEYEKIVSELEQEIEELEQELEVKDNLLQIKNGLYGQSVTKCNQLEDIKNLLDNYEPEFAEDDDFSMFNWECLNKFLGDNELDRKVENLSARVEFIYGKLIDLEVALADKPKRG
jgi:Zn-dependent M16 (insulinase) family peptidase